MMMRRGGEGETVMRGVDGDDVGRRGGYDEGGGEIIMYGEGRR